MNQPTEPTPPSQDDSLRAFDDERTDAATWRGRAEFYEAALARMRDRAEVSDVRAKRAEAQRDQDRATAQSLNLRAQRAESRLAVIERAVDEWKVSDRGTYVPLRTIAAIARVMGVEVDEERLVLHYGRVAELEAALERVRAFAEDMRTWCSPHGIAADYADRLEAVLDGPAAEQPTREVL
jgi:hypothetical protein